MNRGLIKHIPLIHDPDTPPFFLIIIIIHLHLFYSCLFLCMHTLVTHNHKAILKYINSHNNSLSVMVFGGVFYNCYPPPQCMSSVLKSCVILIETWRQLMGYFDDWHISSRSKCLLISFKIVNVNDAYECTLSQNASLNEPGLVSGSGRNNSSN